MSSFFVGYVPGQIPGGILAKHYGGKQILGLGILLTSVLTLVLPLCAPSLPALYVVRALMGFGESVTFPAANVLYTRWAPAPERATLLAFANAGCYLGTACAFPVAGGLIGMRSDANKTYIDSKGEEAHGISTTWPWVFYVFGLLGCVWYVFWSTLAASSPEQQKRDDTGACSRQCFCSGISCGDITDAERTYVIATRGEDADSVIEKVDVAKSPSPPWRAFLTHRAAWAIYIAHSASNWGAYTLLTFLPDYMDTVLGFDIKSSGGLSTLPYLAMFVCAAGAGQVSDSLVRRMPLRRVRIIVLLTSYWLAALFLVLTGYTTDRTTAVAFLTLSIGCSGIASAAYNVNYVDVSPHYAGQLFSIGNTIANITGIVTPIITGNILGDKSQASVGRWRVVFFISAAFYVFATLVWVIFMRGKPVAALN